jgi:predicted CoA-substrate-specific enzyme activase
VELHVGIDAGSVAVKAVALQGGRPRVWLSEPTLPDVRAQTADLLLRVLRAAGTDRPDTLCATGYGRALVQGAGGTVSEIMANALGAGWLWRHWTMLAEVFRTPPHPFEPPGSFRTIIDIGGQDSKVITFTADGLVEQFAMNDRCAAGTGRFLEVMARVLGLDLVTMDELAIGAESPARISATCTVFAESEVVSLLSEGRDKADVAAGIYAAVAERVASLARQVRARGPVLFDGGPSHGRTLRGALERVLGWEVAVPPRGELVTALGAALYGADRAADQTC